MGKHIHNPALKFENDEEERIFLKVMKENMDEYSEKGATGAVQKLVGDMLSGMLGEELKEHLGFDKYERNGKDPENKNARNGYYNKTLLTNVGETQLKVPRDRNGEFSPMVVEKGERIHGVSPLGKYERGC